MKLSKVKRWLNNLDCSDEARKYALLRQSWDLYGVYDYEGSFYNLLFDSRVQKTFKILDKKYWRIYSTLSNSVSEYMDCYNRVKFLDFDIEKLCRQNDLLYAPTYTGDLRILQSLLLKFCHQNNIPQSKDYDYITSKILSNCYTKNILYKDLFEDFSY